MRTARIDATWLSERGYLRDAKITAARLLSDCLEIDLDDQWVNDRGLARRPMPRTFWLVFVGDCGVFARAIDSGGKTKADISAISAGRCLPTMPP